MKVGYYWDKASEEEEEEEEEKGREVGLCVFYIILLAAINYTG